MFRYTEDKLRQAATSMLHGLGKSSPSVMARKFVDGCATGEVKAVVAGVIGLFKHYNKVYIAIRETSAKVPVNISLEIGKSFLRQGNANLQAIHWLSAAEAREDGQGGEEFRNEARKCLISYYGRNKQEAEILPLIDSAIREKDQASITQLCGIVAQWEEQNKTNGIFNALEAGYKKIKNPKLAELVGKVYCYGQFGRSVDLQEAEKIINEHAQPESAFSNFLLGEIYSNQKGGLFDYEKAISAYAKSYNICEAIGDPNSSLMAMAGLAFAGLTLRSSVVENNTKAIDCLTKLATIGHAAAYLKLGIFHESQGQGELAFQSFVKGLNLENNQGIIAEELALRIGLNRHEVDPVMAATYYEAALKLGNEMARQPLAALYANHESPLYSLDKVLEILGQTESAEAQMLLGLTYESQGMDALHIRYSSASAQQGNLLAIYHLAEIHHDSFRYCLHGASPDPAYAFAAYALYECLHKHITAKMFPAAFEEQISQWALQSSMQINSELIRFALKAGPTKLVVNMRAIGMIDDMAVEWTGGNIVEYLKGKGMYFLPGVS